MSETIVKVLLDRRSPRSLGMLGLVVDYGDGKLRTEGIQVPSISALTQEQVDALVSDGNAVRIDAPIMTVPKRPLAALWVGHDFEERARGHNLPLPPIPETASGRIEGGNYWIAPVKHIWRVVDSWVVQALRRVVKNRDPDLASLMVWASPDREETRAALWLVADQAARTRHLEWWTRLARDRGSRDITPSTLVSSFETIIDGVHQMPHSVRVVGLCGHAKAGDSELASFYARRQNVQQIGFGKWLRERERSLGRNPSRRDLQMAGRQMLSTHGALGFCLEVLNGLPPHLPNQSFIIDGIRHMEVYKSLRCLIGDRLTLVSSDRAEIVRRNRLIQDPNERVQVEEVEAVMRDPTENEITELIGQATIKLDGEEAVEANEQLLEKCLSGV